MSLSSDSSDDSPDLKYAVFEQISRVHSTGSFATFGTVKDFVLPGISVNGVGDLRLPLSEDDAHILAKASCQAPFGKGTETLIDESIRKTWETDARSVHFLNKAWQRSVDGIVERAAAELGITESRRRVRADFYKMLLYGKGAMFKPHRDSEKLSGMFGTLVICLPSWHTGGAVCLHHGNKEERFETSESSAFGCSYIAWYTDVVHEVEPVQEGNRWVLTYNLIHDSEDQAPSASILDARTRDFMQSLTQWQDSQSSPEYLVWKLDHKYTKAGLELAHLKGDDYHRVRHAILGSTAHGAIFVMLANMELCVTSQNGEEGGESSDLYLNHMVDTDGFQLSLPGGLPIAEDALLQNVFSPERGPDQQEGGEYLGNQYSEIDRWYKDSVMVLVPKCSVGRFLLGDKPSLSHVAGVISTLQARMEKETKVPTSKDFLVQICDELLSKKYRRDAGNDRFISRVASIAIFLNDADLFKKSVERAASCFDDRFYRELGKSFYSQTLVVEDSDMVEALTKSKKLYQICKNITQCRDGPTLEKDYRGNSIEAKNLNFWLDTILYQTLLTLENAHAEDGKSLVSLILERGRSGLRQFVIYQGVRKFAVHFLQDRSITNALMIELLLRFPDSDDLQAFFEDLLQHILASTVSNFDLLQYAAYVKAHSTRAGPIKELYQRTCAQSNTMSSELLAKIQTQAPSLTHKQAEDFLLPMIRDMMDVIDLSSSNAHRFFYSLFTIYITQTVQQEPKRPRDWGRLEEVASDWFRKDCCEVCPRIIEFLKNSETETMTLPCDDPWKLRHASNSRYLEVQSHKSVDGKEELNLIKTIRWWEEKHRKWEERCSNTLEALQKLPQTKTKECLSDRYDDIMDLRAVKVHSNSHATGLKRSQSQDHDRAGSPVPQKWPRVSEV